jgi:hypothetical protein
VAGDFVATEQENGHKQISKLPKVSSPLPMRVWRIEFI